jgi:hypothetical protein
LQVFSYSKKARGYQKKERKEKKKEKGRKTINHYFTSKLDIAG